MVGDFVCRCAPGESVLNEAAASNVKNEIVSVRTTARLRPIRAFVFNKLPSEVKAKFSGTTREPFPFSREKLEVHPPALGEAD